MKISELKELHGLPMKVTRHEFVEGGWFEIIADSRNNDNYPCFTSNGLATAINNYFNDWELYTPSPKKKKLYAYIAVIDDDFFIRFTTEDNMNAIGSCKAYRAPAFDTEVEE